MKNTNNDKWLISYNREHGDLKLISINDCDDLPKIIRLIEKNKGSNITITNSVKNGFPVEVCTNEQEMWAW
jgi:hypothetical protein